MATELGLKQQLPPWAAPCVVSGAGFGGSPADEHLPLLLLAVAFVGAGMWMFKRFGSGASAQPVAEGATGDQHALGSGPATAST